MWLELFLFSMYNEELETLKQCNAIGVTLLTAFVIVGTFLLLEIIDWINRLPSQNQCQVYSYGDKNGPSEWIAQFPSAGGLYQSPINIDSCRVTYFEYCDPLIWKGYDKTPVSMTITNTGHTVQLTGQWLAGSEPTISGGVLGRKTYNFQFAFLRWGCSDHEGSEHSIQGDRFSLEMQLQHTNSTNPDDIVFLSYFFQISQNDNPVLQPILCKLCEISFPGISTWIFPFPLSRIICLFKDGYYTYMGSLTHPPCTENIRWIIYPEPICISSQQIGNLRKLQSDEGRIMTNCRPLQPVNSREICHYSMDVDDEC